ncbi:hypothetical protein M3P19_02690 [Muricauda sp. 2012CJ35-5]|uniref:DUF4136 domain-containing protein n=1 Tax=Flagellimonas spongiicola TaxID=2942208 RepID=A0ABT0PNF2_9FLAO|nr:hypothetical protein [Allomuricauda spongiicola]MCL6272895.1 hypothetical protein [Allomuricauda spongiicola]
MRNYKTILGLLLLTGTVFSCSTVKVSDTWKDIDASNIKSKDILVVSKSEDNTIRERFEKDMVTQLNSKGFNATESITKYPDLKPIKEGNVNELRKLGNSLLDQGYEVVVLTSLRDIEEYTTTVTSSSTYSVNTFPVHYHRRGYHRSFYRGFGTIYVDGGPSETITSNNKKYILETLVYDLTMPEDEQLLTIITSEVDNPETLGTTSNDFSKQMVKQLSK